jgi:hypothetical protein
MAVAQTSANKAYHEAGQEMFLSYKTRRPTQRPTQSPIQWVAGSFSGVKRPEHEFDCLHPSSAEFKNEWRYASAPLLYLRRRDVGELYFLRRVPIIAKRRITFMSVRLSAPTSAVPTRWIFLKFDFGDFYENLSRNPNLVIIGQKYRALYMNSQVPFIVPTNIKSPKQCRLWVKV